MASSSELSRPSGTASVEIVIPVLNEEAALPRCVETLAGFIEEHSVREWRITVADNGSTDRTREVAAELAARFAERGPPIRVTYLEQRGRGRALKKAWLESDADIRCYMDVDLSTRLDGLMPIVEALESGEYQVGIGSRLLKDSEVVGRKLQREITSRVYNLMHRIMFFSPFRDAQCGFKAVTREAAEVCVPLVKNDNWFFDTELLLIAVKSGFRIKEQPVHWEDDPDTRVKVAATAAEDIKGLLRLRFGGVPRGVRR
ncbi:MAG: glycosyltransferase family 2 protein [Chloroflexi bacterium]|nr:glycosyltransferase family 2 protein [Chloroflexota bacterium]